MKTQPLSAIARQYNCTLGRAAYEILCAAGLEPRRYPVAIRKQRIPCILTKRARFVLALRYLAGPRRPLP